MGTIKADRVVSSIGIRELAGDFLPVWTLALRLYGYLSTASRFCQPRHGLDLLPADEISHHLHHRPSRWAAALAQWSALRFADSALLD